MSVVTRGVRNAFRNQVRTLSIVLILSLSIGLALSMLLAHQAVDQKIKSVKGSVGNTITISPAGFNSFSQVNNALTTDSLNKVKSVAHVTNLTETLSDRLTTKGTSSTPSGAETFGGSSASSNNTTSLKSPITIQNNGNGSFSGGGAHVFIGGGVGTSLPSNFSLPIPITGTTNPAQIDGNDITITSGSSIDATKDTNDTLVSTDMASKNNLKIGSTFTAYNSTMTVKGIFSTSTQSGGNTIIVSLSALQRLSGQSGAISGATATVDSVDNLGSTTQAIKNILGSNADVTNDQDRVNQTITPLQNIQSISLYSLIGSVVAGAVIILLTMIMIVRERRREIGVIKAIGASNVKVIFQFMSEAVTFTLLAAVIGIGIGIAAGNPITNMLVNNSTSSSSSTSTGGPSLNTSGGGPVSIGGGGGGGGVIRANRGAFGGVRNTLSNLHTNVGWDIILYGLGAAVVIAIAGSAVASWFIARVRPAEVMRTE